MAPAFALVALASAVLHVAVSAAHEGECTGVECEDVSSLLQSRMSKERAHPSDILKDFVGVGLAGDFPFGNLDSMQQSDGALDCSGPVTVSKSKVKDVIGPLTNGSKCFGWWNQPSTDMKMLKSIQAQDSLDPYSRADSKLVWRQGSAADIARAMYHANKIPGQTDIGPKSARGIWWMKGSAMPEELYSTMHGTWVPKKKALIVPDAPLGWAWPTKCFSRMALGGAMCSADRTHRLSSNTVEAPQAISYNFGECPEKQFAYDCHNTEGDLSYALMQLHKQNGRLDKTESGMGPLSGTFTLEAPPVGGSNSYSRGCYFGRGGCNTHKTGSYTLVKLIDIDGNTVEPHWSDWVNYAGDVNMFTCAGWASAHDRAVAKRSFEHAC